MKAQNSLNNKMRVFTNVVTFVVFICALISPGLGYFC